MGTRRDHLATTPEPPAFQARRAHQPLGSSWGVSAWFEYVGCEPGLPPFPRETMVEKQRLSGSESEATPSQLA